jgi:hypothetical protein
LRSSVSVGGVVRPLVRAALSRNSLATMSHHDSNIINAQCITTMNATILVAAMTIIVACDDLKNRKENFSWALQRISSNSILGLWEQPRFRLERQGRCQSGSFGENPAAVFPYFLSCVMLR